MSLAFKSGGNSGGGSRIRIQKAWLGRGVGSTAGCYFSPEMAHFGEPRAVFYDDLLGDNLQ